MHRAIVYAAIRRAPDGEEWVDYGTLSLRREVTVQRIREEQAREGREFKKRNPVVGVIKMLAEEVERRMSK